MNFNLNMKCKMKSIFLFGFLDSLTTVEFHKKESTKHSHCRRGRMSRLLGWAPDLRSAQERILSSFPSVQKAYLMETKKIKNSKS